MHVSCYIINLGKLQACKANTNKHHSTTLPREMRMLRITSHIVAIISFSHFHRGSLTTFSHIHQTKSPPLPHQSTTYPTTTAYTTFCTKATPCSPIGHSQGSALIPAAALFST